MAGAKVPIYVCNVCDFASHNQMDLCEHVNTHSFASEFEKLMSVSMGYVEESTAVEENYVESFCPSPCSSNKMESSFCNDLSKKSQVDGNTDKKTWNTENTLLLIDLYNRHDEEFQRSVKKYVWQKIANILNKEKGLSITPQQCDTKWKCLTTTYKQTMKHNSTSGNDPKHWEYFDRIHDILHKKPEINAEATCSTRKGLVTKPNDNTTVNDKPSMSTPSSTNNEYRSSFSLKRKHAEKPNEKRHQEKMQKQDRYLDLMERLVNVFEDKASNKNENDEK